MYQRNRPLEFIDARYSFLNGFPAHYEVPGVVGEAFRRWFVAQTAVRIVGLPVC